MRQSYLEHLALEAVCPPTSRHLQSSAKWGEWFSKHTPDLFYSHSYREGVFWFLPPQDCLILLEFQDTLFAICPNLLQLTFVHTVQSCYICYLVVCPIY